MAVSQRLELRQSQSLVMTPQLQQAIKLLQLSNLELAAYVAQEVEQNPLLARAEPPAPAAGAEPAKPRGDEDNLDDRGGEQPWDGAPPAMPDWGSYADPGGGGADDDEMPGLDQRLPGRVSLREHLLDQARDVVATPAELAIAEALIDSLDEAGYLATPAAELAAVLGTDPGRVEAMRQALLGCEPLGVFAVTLAECLALQLRARDRLDPAMQALLDNLDLMADRRFEELRARCGVDSRDLAEMCAELRRLDPKPALSFGEGAVQPVVPDVLMHRRPDDSFGVELNPETLPRVLVNNRYYARVVPHLRGKEEKGYLTERLQSANWLARALDQRANTILRVAAEIVSRQHLFFVRGIEYLKPLTLRDIAEAIEMHESTVSRVTANKYIATPRGTFELKYFFTASIGGADGGDSHSAEAVRHRIKTLIDAEKPDAVLSDDQLVKILRGEGIDIARRTVAKYREGMNIPSSVRRKREKALQL